MRKNSLETAILAGALVVFLALPSLASAGQVVPPGNSAATQYTQVFPTSGGNVSVGKSIGEPGGSDKPPAKVIGKKTAEELESQGPEGKAVAELAAESAPTPETQPESGEGSGGNQGGGHKQAGAAAGAGNGSGNGGSKPGSRGSGNGGGSQAQGQPSGGGAATNAAASEAAGSGASGVSEVLGQATGSTSGEMGPFLPLVLLGALLLALAYAWRRRQHEPKAAP